MAYQQGWLPPRTPKWATISRRDKIGTHDSLRIQGLPSLAQPLKREATTDVSKRLLKPNERSAINKKLAHLTRSRQDHEVDQRWRATGALDAEGNWHRGDLAEGALAASTRFVDSLDEATKELFYPALTEAWRYYFSAFEVRGQLQTPQLDVNALVLDDQVMVWIGTGHIVVQDTDGSP